MDAAHNSFKKTAFLFASALLLTAPIPASAAATLATTSTSVVIGSSACNNSQLVTVNSTGGSTTPITFSVSVNYPNGTPNGDSNGNWLYATVSGIGTTSTGTKFNASTGLTGVNLTIGLNRSIGGVSDVGSVILTDVNDPTDTITFTVHYQQNTSCGANTGSATNNFITVTPGNVQLTAGSNGQQSQTLSIQDVSGGGYVFTPSVQPAGSWLSVTTSSVTISPNGTTSLTVTGDARQTAGPGTYNGSLTLTPNGGYQGTTLIIQVQFVVTTGTSTGGDGGTNSGTLTIAGSTATTYTTGFSYVAPTIPGNQCISIQDTAAGANSYSTAVTTSSGGNWLLANNQINTTTTQLLAPQYGACVNLSVVNLGQLASGAYQGSVALTSSSGAKATLNVNLYVSAGTAPGITVQPGAIYVFPNVATNSSVQQIQQFVITANPGYTLQQPSLTSSANGFTMSTPTAANNSATFSITSNSSGLIAGVYATTVTVVSSINNTNSTTTITIVLPVGQGPASNPGGGNNGTTAVAPTTLAFQHQQGSSFWTSSKEAQTITITGPQGSQWSANIVYGSGSNWVNLDSGNSGTFGSGPASLVVDLFNGVTNLAPSTTPYQATVNITTPNGQFSVAVSVLVTPGSTPVLLGLPAVTTFNATTGSNPPNQNVQVVGSDNTSSATNPPLTIGAPTASWLTATASGNLMTISVNASGQTSGLYTATIPVSASAYSNPINYPVVLVVNGGGSGSTGPLSFDQGSLTFSNVTAQASQNIGVTAAATTSFTASASQSSCNNQSWLSIGNGSVFTASPNSTPVQVNVNPSGIANSTVCTGVITFATSSANQTVNVTMTVGGSSSGGNVTVSPMSMTFNYTQNQAVPPTQNAAITNAVSGTAGISFTVTTNEASGTSVTWLQANANSGTTPMNNPGLGISVAPGNLNPGQYTGTVTITPNGGTAQVIAVTLNIAGTAVVTATPTTITLTYTVGQTSPTSTVQVSAGGASSPFTAQASSTGTWLAVSPTSGTTPNTGTNNLTVSLVPSALATLLPSSTPYTGTIVVAGTSPATGTTNINVSLTVTAPLPTISGVTNAGSYATGPVSPGELISIFSSDLNHPIGPATAVSIANAGVCAKYDAQNNCTQLPTTLGGVQVKFLPGGQFAPLIFVSQGQINAVVPYEVAGQAGLSVEVLYLGQTSNIVTVNQNPTAPGFFTATQSGSGQIAANQYDDKGTFQGANLPATPAKAGWTLVLYLTGEGTVSPKPTNGSVTVYNANANPPVPVPLVAPTVTIGNQPATVSFYGEAPGLVSGVLQINVIVPAGAGTGAQKISVALGAAATQTSATVSLQ